MYSTPNDNIQDILFDKQSMVDLRSYSVKQRLIKQVTKTRLQLKHRIKFQRSTKQPTHYYIFSAQNSKPEDLTTFNERLKHNPNTED